MQLHEASAETGTSTTSTLGMDHPNRRRKVGHFPVGNGLWNIKLKWHELYHTLRVIMHCSIWVSLPHRISLFPLKDSQVKHFLLASLLLSLPHIMFYCNFKMNLKGLTMWCQLQLVGGDNQHLLSMWISSWKKIYSSCCFIVFLIVYLLVAWYVILNDL